MTQDHIVEIITLVTTVAFDTIVAFVITSVDMLTLLVI
jgi:hypothetical protein